MGRDFSPSSPARQGRGLCSGFWSLVPLCAVPAPQALQVPGFFSVFNSAAGSAQAGAAAPGGGTRRRGPAPLLSPACKYLLPRWKSDYFARARLAKSLSKHAQMTAPGGLRHAHYPSAGLVTLGLQPRGLALLITLGGQRSRPTAVSSRISTPRSSPGRVSSQARVVAWISVFGVRTPRLRSRNPLHFLALGPSASVGDLVSPTSTQIGSLRP